MKHALMMTFRFRIPQFAGSGGIRRTLRFVQHLRAQVEHDPCS